MRIQQSQYSNSKMIVPLVIWKPLIFLVKCILTESMLLLLLIDLFRFGKKEHLITLIVSVLWVTAISLALGILRAMKKPLRFTMKSYGETLTIIRHYARLVVCTVTDGDLHKISPTLLPCLKMHGEKVLAELRQKSVCCICLIWKKP